MSAASAVARPVTGVHSAADAGWNFFPFRRPAPHPAVVRITVKERRATAQGTGTLVSLRGQHGLIVTNWHVVRDAQDTILVTFPDGFQSAATVLKVDRDWDLAALLIWRPAAQPIPISQVAPRPGDVLSIAGYGSGDYRTASGRCTQYVAPGQQMPYEMVEVSTEARQGDSGGPILNERGELAAVLFGAGDGTTSGSYCGRVRLFLESAWPNIDQPEDQFLVSANSQPVTSWPPEAAASASVQSSDTAHQALNEFESPAPSSAEDPDALPPAEWRPSTIQQPAVASRWPILSDPPVRRTDETTTDWAVLIGKTPLERGKTILAGIGVLAVLSQLLGWNGRKK